MITVKGLYERSLPPWGGATVSRDTGDPVADGIDAYAVTIKQPGTDTIQIPGNATLAQFTHAYDQACEAFRYAPYLGIFHDADARVIEFDPVAVVSTTDEVDEIARHYPVTNGAYHFKTGNGYFGYEKVYA